MNTVSTNKAELHSCVWCNRPYPNRFTVEVNGQHLCLQCVEELVKLYQSIQNSGRIEAWDDLMDMSSNNIDAEALIVAYKKMLDENPDALVNYDEYVNLAAGMSIRLDQGDFDGDVKVCYEELWKFQAGLKFNRYVELIAGLNEEPTYEQLCDLLVLPRPTLDEITPLVRKMQEKHNEE